MAVRRKHMKRTYYKEAMIGDKVYKGDRVSITTKDDEVMVTEYVDFVGGVGLRKRRRGGR